MLLRNRLFESFVNSEEYQTKVNVISCWNLFESFVNSEEYQTNGFKSSRYNVFESFVNSEEYQTIHIREMYMYQVMWI